MRIDHVTCSNGATYRLGFEAIDIDRHTRASLPDLVAAHLRASASISASVSVTQIVFTDDLPTFHDGRHERWLNSSYCDGFVA